MKLFLDSSALVKRYVREPGRDLVVDLMDRADAWYVCELAFVETMRAVGLATGVTPSAFEREWREFNVVTVDHTLSISAASLAEDHSLRTLDAYHVAAANLLRTQDITVLTWDTRMSAACAELGLRVLPEFS